MVVTAVVPHADNVADTAVTDADATADFATDVSLVLLFPLL